MWFDLIADPDEDLRPKSKKSLHFTTPKKKCPTALANSPPSPSPLTPLDNFLLSHSGSVSEKRCRSEETSELLANDDNDWLTDIGNDFLIQDKHDNKIIIFI